MTTDAGTGAAGAGAGTGDAGAAGAGAAGAGAAGGGAAPWYGSLSMADPIVQQHIAGKFDSVEAYVKNKGWTGGGDVLKSYLGVQGLLGRDPSTLIPLPRADDPEGYRAVFARLGMPETPDKYELAAGPGGAKLDENYEKWARDTFHKAGLTAQQVKALTTEQTAFAAAQQAKAEADYKAQRALDETTLQQEWRGGYERKMGDAKLAAQNLGFTEDMINAMEQTVGFAETMRFFAGLGTKLGEDTLSTGTQGSGPKFAGGMTPEEAKAQWAAMQLDPAVMKALMDPTHPSHKAQAAKKTSLFKVMFPS